MFDLINLFKYIHNLKSDYPDTYINLAIYYESTHSNRY